MSDSVSPKLSGKILFGVDYINLMDFTQNADENENYDVDKQDLVFSIYKLFLLQWDFSGEEIDLAMIAYKEKWDTNNHEPTIDPVIDRICEFLKDDKNAQEKLLIEVAAVSQMDDTFLNRERYTKEILQSKFDFRPSKVDELYKKGWTWRLAFNFVGEQYIKLASKSKIN